MPQLTHASRATTPESLWQTISEQGAVIVDDFLSSDLLARLRDEVMPAINAHPAGAATGHDFWKRFHGATTKRITGLADLSPAWGELLCDPLYKAMGDHFLGEDDYYLNTGQLICIGPGEDPQMPHRDELNWPHAAGRDNEITITAIFALTDFTEDNGATVVAPGSNHWPGAMPEVPPETTCQAVMPAGAALLYSGKVIHGGGPNSSNDQWRVGLHAGFVSGWLRAEEAHQLTTSVETARRLKPFAQQMLGFRSYLPPKAARLGLVNYEDAATVLDQPR